MQQSFLQQLSQLSYGSQGLTILANFIVLEGLDGSGTSTQARLLEQHFQGQPCKRSAEPSEGRIGQHIRSLLQQSSDEPGLLAERQKLPQYFAADRAEHLWAPDGLCAQTQAGVICISERYLFSSLVYQGQDRLLAELWELNREFPLPQHLVYLDISAELAEQRIAQREQHNKRDIFEEVEFLAQVRQSYLAVIKHFRQIAPAMQIHHLNADQSQEALQLQILQGLGL